MNFEMISLLPDYYFVIILADFMLSTANHQCYLMILMVLILSYFPPHKHLINARVRIHPESRIS